MALNKAEFEVLVWKDGLLRFRGVVWKYIRHSYLTNRPTEEERARGGEEEEVGVEGG